MKISKWKLVYHIIFTKNFFTYCLGGLNEVIMYAINNFHEKSGEGASDVLYFYTQGMFEKIKK